MNNELVEKICFNPACSKTWKQLRKDTQKFHSKVCEEEYLKHNVIQKKRPGRESWSAQKKKENIPDNTTSPTKIELNKKESLITEKNSQAMIESHLSKEIGYLVEKTITPNPKTKEENVSEEITTDIKIKNNLKREVIITTNQQQKLIELSQSIKEERLNSIEQLNYVAKYLLSQSSSDMDFNSKVNCLTEFRNIMRLKLDYIKFGKELMES